MKLSHFLVEGLGVLVALTLFVGTPALLIWGWTRWPCRTRPLRVASVFSWIGLALATASALIYLRSASYAVVIGGFPFYDPVLMRIYRTGSLLSLVALMFGFAGAFTTGPVRWHAPVAAAGTLFAWFAAAMGD
jgi:hypothetical protein